MVVRAYKPMFCLRILIENLAMALLELIGHIKEPFLAGWSSFGDSLDELKKRRVGF